MPAKTRAEPIIEIGKSDSFPFVAGKIDLGFGKWFGAEHGKPDHVEAEAGVVFIGQSRQPFDEKSLDFMGIPQGPGGAGGDPAQDAIGAE